MKIFGNNFDLKDADLIVLPVCWSLNSDVNFDKIIKPIIQLSNEIELFHEFYGFQKGNTAFQVYARVHLQGPDNQCYL